MEITAENFVSELPEILGAISRASAVAVDCEFTGIPNHTDSGSSTGGRSHKPLQQRYSELRTAAQKYGIIQFGMTILEQNDVSACRLRTYNFNIRPLADSETERFGVAREIVLQSGAIRFLTKHGVRVGESLEKGVGYLSREEVCLIVRNIEERYKTLKEGGVSMDESDTMSLDFVQRTMSALDSAAPCFQTGGSLLIESKNGVPFLDYQRRLVRRLLDAEYPHLTIEPGQKGADRIGVCHRDHIYSTPNEGVRRAKRGNNPEKIGRVVGFRWLMEAICLGGGRLRTFHFTQRGLDQLYDFTYEDRVKYQDALDRINKRHELGDHISIVGHNLLADLMYLCQSFLFDLPEDVTDFRWLVNKEFPCVVDTKWMCTQDWVPGEMQPESSLGLCHRTLGSRYPCDIDIHPDFEEFLAQKAAHSAGYDSYMTACVFLLALKSPPPGTTQEEDGDTPEPDDDSEEDVDSNCGGEEGICGALPADWLPDPTETLARAMNRLRVFGAGQSSVMDLDPGREVDPAPVGVPKGFEVEFSVIARKRSDSESGAESPPVRKAPRPMW